MSACRSCGASILWAVTGAQRRPIPLDAVPAVDGNIELDRTTDPPYAKTWGTSHAWSEGTHRYRSHFSTCPQAAEHRRRR